MCEPPRPTRNASLRPALPPGHLRSRHGPVPPRAGDGCDPPRFAPTEATRSRLPRRRSTSPPHRTDRARTRPRPQRRATARHHPDRRGSRAALRCRGASRQPPRSRPDRKPPLLRTCGRRRLLGAPGAPRRCPVPPTAMLRPHRGPGPTSGRRPARDVPTPRCGASPRHVRAPGSAHEVPDTPPPVASKKRSHRSRRSTTGLASLYHERSARQRKDYPWA